MGRNLELPPIVSSRVRQSKEPPERSGIPSSEKLLRRNSMQPKKERKAFKRASQEEEDRKGSYDAGNLHARGRKQSNLAVRLSGLVCGVRNSLSVHASKLHTCLYVALLILLYGGYTGFGFDAPHDNIWMVIATTHLHACASVAHSLISLPPAGGPRALPQHTLT